MHPAQPRIQVLILPWPPKENAQRKMRVAQPQSREQPQVMNPTHSFWPRRGLLIIRCKSDAMGEREEELLVCRRDGQVRVESGQTRIVGRCEGAHGDVDAFPSRQGDGGTVERRNMALLENGDIEARGWIVVEQIGGGEAGQAGTYDQDLLLLWLPHLWMVVVVVVMLL